MATYSPRSELKSFEDGIHLEPNVCVLNIAGTLLMVLNCNSQIRLYSSKRKDIYVKKSSCFFKQEKNKTEILKKMLIVCIMLKAKKGAK